MISEQYTIDQWLNAAINAAKETADSALSCSHFHVNQKGSEQDASGHGAYVALHANDESVYVGLLSSMEGCEYMTRALLGMAADEESPSDEDIADAVSEITNILAGVMSTQLAQDIPKIELGLPIFVHGKVAPSARQKTISADVAFNEIGARIVMISGSDVKQEALL